MKRSIMKVVSIGFAFITSFLLTVTVYAAVASEGDSVNKNYLGKYTNKYNPGYIWAKEGNLQLFACRDDNYLCFITGTLGTYMLRTGNHGFHAEFPVVSRVTLNGDPAVGDHSIYDYTASGDVSFEVNIFNIITKVKIAPYQSTVVYELKK